jgi:hypothetical protein
MLYNIVFVDSGAYSEIPPEIKTLELTDDEFKDIKELVDDFNDERMPYFYPQMYIYKVVNEDINDVKDFIEEQKQNVIVWKEKEDKRQQRRRDREESEKLKLKGLIEGIKSNYYGDSFLQ